MTFKKSARDRKGSSEVGNCLSKEVINQIWHEMGGRFTHDQINQVSKEIAIDFKDAVIETFLPIFIVRKTREKLRELIDP